MQGKLELPAILSSELLTNNSPVPAPFRETEKQSCYFQLQSCPTTAHSGMSLDRAGMERANYHHDWTQADEKYSKSRRSIP
eukprot:1156549-Pelagomonas_calceolata.AAC.3